MWNRLLDTNTKIQTVYIDVSFIVANFMTFGSQCSKNTAKKAAMPKTALKGDM
jgi:hypothetical protein